LKLAIVTPWFGEACETEAELRARRLAQAFCASGHEVDVLATASRGPGAPWDRNDLPLGTLRKDGYSVRRFPVDRREAAAFDRADAVLRLQTPRSARTVLSAGVAAGYAENIRSSALLEYLRASCDDRAAFLFMPYRWQPVLEGIPIVASRAYVQPCLQREAYAFLPAVATAIHAARGLFFNSEAEYRLALHIFGPGIREKSVVIGEWIDEPERSSFVEGPGDFAPARERFVLYLGPRDETKNVGLLVEAFVTFRERHGAASLKLVLAGPGLETYGDPDCGIFDLGELGWAECARLLEYAQALAEPSYDCVSSFVLEAFGRGCPAAVNADGPWPALFADVRSGLEAGAAGWQATTKSEWAQAFEAIDRSDRFDRERRSRAVRHYFERHASVARAVGQYESAFARAAAAGSGVPAYHVVASDDLTDDAVRRGLALADFSGYAGMPATAAIGLDAHEDGMVVIHSPRADHLRAALLGAPAIGALVYDTAAFLDSRREAFEVATAARLGVGTSEVAVQFLQDAGVAATQEIPFVSGTRCWDVSSDPEMARLLDDGKANCVYAGPFDWNADLDRLVAAFAFLLALEVDARLILCGPLDAGAPAQQALRETIAENGLAGRVLFVSSADPGRLSAVFRAAAIFWTLGATATSLSPLVDAMWFDIPILAYASAPCAALLGPAGLLLRDTSDAGRIAGLAKILIRDEGLRAKVLFAQSLRREALSYDRAAGARCAGELFGSLALEASRP
jgi:glycosyltransferase involved in cell wall biosynthesis